MALEVDGWHLWQHRWLARGDAMTAVKTDACGHGVEPRMYRQDGCGNRARHN
jgi:hypothetical protein